MKRVNGLESGAPRSLVAIRADVADAIAAAFPDAPNLVRRTYRLLGSGESSAKLRKGSTVTFGLSMPPSRVWLASDGRVSTVRPDGAGWQYLGNVCPWSDGCEETCIASTGRYGMGQSVARVWVRVLWKIDRPLFLELLGAELANLDRWARRRGLRVAVRLNVTADIRFERHIGLARFEHLTFYDYTKAPAAARSARPANYDLTFSVTRSWTVRDMRRMVAAGERIAVVVPTAVDADVSTFAGIDAVNGDMSDERFKDPTSVAVLLRVKRPTNGAPVSAIYAGGMVRTADGRKCVRPRLASRGVS